MELHAVVSVGAVTIKNVLAQSTAGALVMPCRVDHESGCVVICFFVRDAATTEIYTVRNTLSLHDALPIYQRAAFAGEADRFEDQFPGETVSGPDRKSTRLNSSHFVPSRMPSSA